MRCRRYWNWFPSSWRDRSAHHSMFEYVAAKITGRIASLFVSNIYFHFINTAVFVFKRTSFPSADTMECIQHSHAWRSVQPEIFQYNPIPKETLDLFQGPLRCVVCCPIFLKITKWQFLVIHMTYRFLKTVEVDISIDCCVGGYVTEHTTLSFSMDGGTDSPWMAWGSAAAPTHILWVDVS